jgi:hypothetical protein
MSIFGTPATAHGGARFASSAAASALNTATGDLLIVGVGFSDGGTCTGVTDTAGNTYVPLTQRVGAFGEQFQFWYCLSATANASNVVAAAFSISNNNIVVFAWDVPVSASPIYDTDTASDGGSDATTASFSTTGTDEFVATMAYDQFGGGGYSAGGGYTLDSASFDTFGGAQHTVFSSTQSGITANFPGHSGGSAAFAAAFKASGGGGGGGSAQPVVCVMQ